MPLTALAAALAALSMAGLPPFVGFVGKELMYKGALEAGASVAFIAFVFAASALMFAARNGHEEVVTRLLKAGARLDLKNDQGETAESWALKHRNTDIAELIGAERKARAARGK